MQEGTPQQDEQTDQAGKALHRGRARAIGKWGAGSRLNGQRTTDRSSIGWTEAMITTRSCPNVAPIILWVFPASPT